MTGRTRFGLFSVTAGVAHLVAPSVFAKVTAGAFPDEPDVWVRRNGITEIAIGLAFLAPVPAKVGKVGISLYASWVGYNLVRVQGRRLR